MMRYPVSPRLLCVAAFLALGPAFSLSAETTATRAAFLKLIDADTDEDRRTHQAAHARQLRTHVDQLSKKEYWKQFGQAPQQGTATPAQTAPQPPAAPPPLPSSTAPQPPAAPPPVVRDHRQR